MTTDGTMQTSQQSCLDSATALAAAGKYDSALEMLGAVTLPELALPVSLLRAKIHGQLCEHSDAQHEWEKALAIAPGSEEAQQGLRLTKRLREGGQSRLLVRARLHYGVLVALIVVLAATLTYVLTRGPARPTGPDSAQWLALRKQELQTTRDLAEAMRTTISAADKRNEEAAKRLQSALEALGAANASLSRQVDGESATLRKMAERLDAVETQQAEGVSQLAGQLAECLKRLEHLNSYARQAATAAETQDAAAREADAVHSRALAAMQQAIVGLAEKVELLANGVSDQGETVGRIMEKVDAQAREMTVMASRLEDDRTKGAAERAALTESLGATRSDVLGLVDAVGRTTREFGIVEQNLSGETADLKAGLQYVLRFLAPEGVQSYPGRIENLRQEADKLRAELQKTEPGEGIPLVAQLTRRLKAGRLDATERELRVMEGVYQQQIVPWQRAMDAVKCVPPDQPERAPAKGD